MGHSKGDAENAAGISGHLHRLPAGKNLAEAYASSDNRLPSTTDTFGNGWKPGIRLPVIVSDGAGPELMQDKNTGLVTKSDSLEELISAMRLLLLTRRGQGKWAQMHVLRRTGRPFHDRRLRHHPAPKAANY